MLPQGSLARLFADGIDVIGVGVEGDLGIDDEVTAAGQVDDDISACGFTAAAVLLFDIGEGLLEGVLLALAQAGFFEQVAQDELAPVALGLGGAAQGGGEVVGLGGELLVEL